LLDGGVDVNATPYCRQTALHYAAYIGRAEVVEELLARGADTSVVDTQTNQKCSVTKLPVSRSEPSSSGV